MATVLKIINDPLIFDQSITAMHGNRSQALRRFFMLQEMAEDCYGATFETIGDFAFRYVDETGLQNTVRFCEI